MQDMERGRDKSVPTGTPISSPRGWRVWGTLLIVGSDHNVL